MFAIAVLAPLLHGAIGPLDELELCVAPIVVVIILLVVKFRQNRAARKYDRSLPRMGLSNARKKRSRH
jgi:hypothetical protein